jgi:hypothetical protein
MAVGVSARPQTLLDVSGSCVLGIKAEGRDDFDE